MNYRIGDNMRIPILDFKGKPETSFQIITQQQLEEMIKELLPYYIADDSWYFDNYYVALPITKFREVLLWWWDILKKIQYQIEVFDCDDYSKLFSSLLASCQYNSAGLVIGELYYKGKFIGYHAWNLLLFINQQGKFKLYEFEPQIANILIDHKSFDGFEYIGKWVIW